MTEIDQEKKIKIERLKIVMLSVAIYIISLTQSAFTIQDCKMTQSYSSIQVLIVGSIAFLGGGLKEWIIWLANPLYVISIFLFLLNDKYSRIISYLALFLAFFFLFWRNVLTSEGGQESLIIFKGFGYWLWLLSILILAVNISRNFKPKQIENFNYKEKFSKDEEKEQKYWKDLKEQIKKNQK